jgi:hypothetical protein
MSAMRCRTGLIAPGRNLKRQPSSQIGSSQPYIPWAGSYVPRRFAARGVLCLHAVLGLNRAVVAFLDQLFSGAAPSPRAIGFSVGLRMLRKTGSGMESDKSGSEKPSN